MLATVGFCILALVATRWDTIVPCGSAFDTFHMDTITDGKHMAPCL
jgi:uncharacterized membrane protein